MDRITPFAEQRFVLLALGPAAAAAVAAAAAAARAGAGEFQDRSQGESRDRGIALSAHCLDWLFRLIVTSFICLFLKAGFPMRGKTVSQAPLTLWVRDGGGTPSLEPAAQLCAGACVCVGVASYLPGVHCSPSRTVSSGARGAWGGLADRSQLAGGRPGGRGGSALLLGASLLPGAPLRQEETP